MRTTVITSVCLILLASASAQQKKQLKPAVRDGDLVAQVFSAWNSHDPEKVLAFYTDEVVYEDVPLGVVNHGKTELRKFVEDTLTAFPDLKVQLVSSSIWNSHGVSEVVWGGTDKGYWKTNKQFSVRMLSTFELQRGKFSRNKDFYDLSSIMRQVGVLPAEAVSGSTVLEAYVSAWNRHDFAALDKLLTPDALHEDIAWSSHDEGPAQIKKFMREMIAIEPDFDWRLTNIIESGSTVAAEWTWTATYTGDCPTVGHVVGMHATGRGASVAVIENGRIKRFTDYYDFASFCRAGSVNDQHAPTTKSDEAEIRALYDRWARAFEAHDIEGIMSVYAPGDAVISYDIAPPLQYKGSDAYRKDYLDFLAQYDGPIHVEYRDMRILSSGEVGFLHALERITGKLKHGEQSDFWIRATSGVRKINGKWLIVHDHLSVPTDFESGKAMLDLKP